MQFTVDFRFVNIGSGSVIDEDALISCRRPKISSTIEAKQDVPPYYEVRSANVMRSVVIGAGCVLSAPCSISDAIEVKPLTGVMPFSDINRPIKTAVQGNLPQSEVSTFTGYLRRKAVFGLPKGRKHSLAELL